MKASFGEMLKKAVVTLMATVFFYISFRDLFFIILFASEGRFLMPMQANGVFNRVRCRQHEFVRQESFQIYFLVFFRPVDADVFGDFFIRTGIFWHPSERRPVYS